MSQNTGQDSNNNSAESKKRGITTFVESFNPPIPTSMIATSTCE